MDTRTAERPDIAPAPAAPPAGVVAVVAHRKKTFGGGLDELRSRLVAAGVGRLLWYEVPKSRKAPKRVRAALDSGAELVLVWGGDGMVQRCADALAGSGVPMGILPAGTANLFAVNLGIPVDLPEAVRIALHGRRRELDLGRINGEHFAVMAGAGFDGDLIRDADRQLKGRFGRIAYVWTGLRHVRGECVRTRIRVDGADWFDDEASCVLFGNVGTITGGIPAFDDARPDDGALEVGVSTASGAVDWARTLGRMAAGRSDESPFVRITRGRKIKVRFDAPKTYELDGGARGKAKRLKVKVVPGALTVCCPDPAD
ncbi:diacylglycerol kinase family lipid kinase [Micromonospora tulbaghiae]|uniref:Diacylglycerol kinase family enzyme n=1 Tax=Micromonospora tulbaghiae TaxID=479978 RepID=A0AAW4JDA5_9ACTN|nr:MULTISPECIES: diacylglycerol kinase family protein [Micromonospora]KAB1905240.1 diacylglycerol kinase family lipid kinase [Micromonospora sp. AMSO1212t]MBO4139818.1 diacylglycerol kinase family lipid kinase [Micromonospora tulbaghiae]MDX5458779.1 diacylglycerol kinase family lipid kinase [Micromonospora tulbaghiae]SCE78148.1 Diacylglycerol kinase family enzyme [Micromonospora tulbaghiae]